jgi:MoaA/NifB/PqqE/SkfB family radical SAM enzyme
MTETSKAEVNVADRLESLWLELTQKCNLACNHCYADAHRGQDLLGAMTHDDWSALLDGAAGLGCSYIQFIGGEPLLHPCIEELARKARHLEMHVEVLTNGTVLPARALEWMSALQVSVSTSVYSACAEDHDLVTGRRGSWNRTVSNIECMIGCGIPVRAGIIYRDWELDRVEETAAFLETRGVVVGTDHVRKIGRGGSTNSAKEYLNTLCGACGHKRVCVTSSGDVYPCIMARNTCLGNVKAAKLESVLSGTMLSEFRDSLGSVKRASDGCTPDCWPHGGCAPHDVCNPQKSPAHRSLEAAGANCTPDCWPHGGCAPHDLCNPHKMPVGQRAQALGHAERSVSS